MTARHRGSRSLNSRRDFLKYLGALGAAGALPPLAMPLTALASSLSPAGTDYRAIVCVYLEGGLDHHHTLVPYDTASYNAMAALRPNFLPARSVLAQTRLATTTPQGGREAALFPTLSALKPLYDQGRLALVYGSGNLDEPVTRAGLYNGTQRLPSAAGSHNDGGSFVHSGGPEGTTTGWGGLLCDALGAANPNSMFASINVGNNCLFGAGNLTRVITVGEFATAQRIAGTEGTLFGSSVAAAELNALVRRGSDANALAADYLGVTGLVQDSAAVLQSAFTASQSVAPIPTDTSLPDYQVAWRDNRLVAGLRTVLRIIHQRSLLNVRRQVFFVRLGGFDNHGGLVQALGNDRFVQLSTALKYFYDNLSAMGLAGAVTTLTTSEFGRSVGSNGDGTDHGWGGLQFVMGDAVRGREIYGALQDINVNGPGFYGLGGPAYSIPFIANDQVSATVARWFGASDAMVDAIFPRLSRFASRYLDFMFPA